MCLFVATYSLPKRSFLLLRFPDLTEYMLVVDVDFPLFLIAAAAEM